MRLSRHSEPSARLAACLLCIGLTGCGDDFEPSSKINSVRVLAMQTSAPFARPGEAVTVRALAIDGRDPALAAARPMQLAYFPNPCVNPAFDDVRYCYPALAAAYRKGDNLQAQLSAGDAFSFAVPQDAIETRLRTPGPPGAGSVYTFFTACAGHIELVGMDANYPDKPPFGCFNDAGVAQSGREYVFAFAKVYVEPEERNANPTFDGVTVDGVAVNETDGVTVTRCTKTTEADCATVNFDTQVAAASQENDPRNSLPGGPVAREQVNVDYYVTAGKMRTEGSVLYDTLEGRIADSRTKFSPFAPAGDYTLAAVVRDSRGGAAWRTYPLRIR